MSEWVIPYNDIEFKELIGKGRMGEVHKYVLYYDLDYTALYRSVIPICI